MGIYDLVTKNRMQTPLGATAYKIHFEALDGTQPKIAETVEEKEPYMPGMPIGPQPRMPQEGLSNM
jgi:hypothetical protein